MRGPGGRGPETEAVGRGALPPKVGVEEDTAMFEVGTASKIPSGTKDKFQYKYHTSEVTKMTK